jgi:hypothetical protein
MIGLLTAGVTRAHAKRGTALEMASFGTDHLEIERAPGKPSGTFEQILPGRQVRALSRRGQAVSRAHLKNSWGHG